MPTIEDRITTVLVAVLANGMSAGEISHDADLVDEYGLDSLQMIAFLLGVEDELGIALDYPNLELDHLRSVTRFTAYLAATPR